MSSEMFAIRHSKCIQKLAPSPTETPALSSPTEIPPLNVPPIINHADSDSSDNQNDPHAPPILNHTDPDSSDNTIIIQNARGIMSDQKTATVSHPILSCAPILTDGKITPKIIRDFKNHCSTYFLNAKDCHDHVTFQIS
ncbi:hypothetical protein EDB85DRAFT_2157734 [Lactarius pseudohatsudake]|nr:hypothetical protein EDB85DRAFT_2157734 [Lactarius pseudohatsudake]